MVKLNRFPYVPPNLQTWLIPRFELLKLMKWINSFSH